MTSDDLRAWQGQMGYTYDSASEALGISRATYAAWLAGTARIPKMCLLACKYLLAQS